MARQKLELTWIGKEKRPKLEPRILLEDPEKSYHAKHRVAESDIFDNRLIFGDNLLALKALEHLKGASGRLELVGQTKAGALAYVDYAHKPEALENVLTSVRPFTTGRVIVVFGCGGDRDKGKQIGRAHV